MKQASEKKVGVKRKLKNIRKHLEMENKILPLKTLSRTAKKRM